MAKKTTAPKTAKQTIDEMRADLEAKQKRLNAFGQILESIDAIIHSNMEARVKTPSHYETYTDENGEEKRKYIWAEYEEDENGNTIYDEPTEGDWKYEDYKALCAVRDEILTLL